MVRLSLIKKLGWVLMDETTSGDGNEALSSNGIVAASVR